MNHRRRAENALRRVMAPHYHVSDLFELLADEFARVLRQVENEAYRGGLAAAANAVGYELRKQDVERPIDVPVFKVVYELLEKRR